MLLRLEKNAAKDPYAILSAAEIRGLDREVRRRANRDLVTRIVLLDGPKHGRVAPDPRPSTP